MAKRPSVYVSFGDDETSITVDMRVHAPKGSDPQVIKNEITFAFMELADKAAKKWTQRDSSMVQRRPHKPKITGSTPVPASGQHSPPGVQPPPRTATKPPPPTTALTTKGT